MNDRTQRIILIKEQIMSKGRVEVEELRRQFGVSAVTIRSDLNELEKTGSVRRTYGGAELARPAEEAVMPRFLLRDETIRFSPAKKRVAELAAGLVEENEWIFLGCGDTCAAIAMALGQRTVQVVTNSLLAASVLALNSRANVLMTGGSLCGYDRHFLSGSGLERSLEGLRVSKAFFGATAFSPKAGFTCTSVYESGVFRAVQAVADRTIFALESAKFGQTSFMRIARPEEISLVVTDRPPQPEHLQALVQKRVEVLY